MTLFLSLLLASGAFAAPDKVKLMGFRPGEQLPLEHDLKCAQGECSKQVKFRGFNGVLTVTTEGLYVSNVVLQVSFVHAKKWKKAAPADVERIGGNFADDPEEEAEAFLAGYRKDLEGRRWVKIANVEISRSSHALVMQKKSSEMNIVVRDFTKASKTVIIRLLPRDMTPGRTLR